MTGTALPDGQASLPTPNSTKSFWHKEPSRVLLGHRTTEKLPSSADIVVVGSGISGACATHFLREDERGRDLNIVMLEAREACWGATGRNGGHCQPLLYSGLPEISAFEVRNYQALKALVEKHDIQCDWRTLTGVHAYMSEDMFLASLEIAKGLQQSAPELAKLVQIITKDSVSPSLEDLRVPRAVGAFVQAHAASLWPYKLVAWILENLLAGNNSSTGSFNLQTTTPVSHLQRTEDGSSWLVHTPRGMISSKQVLLTTNAYTSHLLPHFSDLIVPVRGDVSSLLPPKAMSPTSVINRPLAHSYAFLGHDEQNIDQDDYLVQRPFILPSDGSHAGTSSGGELIFGGGRIHASHSGVGVSDDSSIDISAAAYLRRELNKVLDLGKSDHELEATYEWSGIMGFSRDACPWVGEVTEDLGLGGGEGLWICAGFTGHGMPNACLSAKAAVEMMMGSDEGKVDLPKAYTLSKERITIARMSDEVSVVDARGCIKALTL